MAKIKEEQLETIVKYQDELTAILNNIGVLETQKHALLHKVAEVNEGLEKEKAPRKSEGLVHLAGRPGGRSNILSTSLGNIRCARPTRWLGNLPWRINATTRRADTPSRVAASVVEIRFMSFLPPPLLRNLRDAQLFAMR